MVTVARSGWFILMLFAALFLLVGPVAAQEETPAEEGETVVEVPAPAISIPEDDAGEATPAWSYRFLVPATMVLGTVAVVGAIIMYFVRVTRNRYRVVK